MMILSQSFTIPNGVTVKNRLFKSAMSETLAGPDHQPDERLFRLYRRWARGGAGIVVTGNVMIDSRALGEPGNVVVEDERHLAELIQWAEAGTEQQTHLWMQLNHPGRQSPRSLSDTPVAPSEVALKKQYRPFFSTPRALSIEEITAITDKFGRAAEIARKAGFTGVQIHAAHGYLISQFLSPLTNRRQDVYGGTLENRMRFLIDIYFRIREKVGPEFPVSVKLNISDFSEGGFSTDEARKVIKTLDKNGIDLIELSGGNYENPRMFDPSEKDVFFIDDAKQIQEEINAVLVITGGFRSTESMEKALACDHTKMVGLARPMVLYPDLPKKLLNKEIKDIQIPRLTTGLPFLDRKIGGLMGISYYEQQIRRLADGQDPLYCENGWKPLWNNLKIHGRTALSPRRFTS